MRLTSAMKDPIGTINYLTRKKDVVGYDSYDNQ